MPKDIYEGEPSRQPPPGVEGTLNLDGFLGRIFRDRQGKREIGQDEVVAIQPSGFKTRRWVPGMVVPAGRVHFNISTLDARKLNPRAHAPSRAGGNLAKTYCAVLDDIGVGPCTKVDPRRIKLRPSWKLITRVVPRAAEEGAKPHPDHWGPLCNMQWGFCLSYPSDPAKAAALIEALAVAELTDGGSKGANHIFRVPGSTKGDQDPPFAAILIEENWDVDYTLSQLELGLGVTSAGPRAAGGGQPPLGRDEIDPIHNWLLGNDMYTGVKSKDFLEIVCPWADAHTNADATAGYAPSSGGGAFHCFHDHCSHRKTQDLREWIVKQDPSARVQRRDGGTDWAKLNGLHGLGAKANGANGHAGTEHAQANGHDAGTGCESSAPDAGPFDGSAEDDLYRHMMDEPIVTLPVLVEGLISGECAGIISGSGGAGKGILLQALATCVASPSSDFLGKKTEHGRAVFLTAEDSRRVLINRQDKICREFGIAKKDLADTLVLKSVTNDDMFLFGEKGPTPLALKLAPWLGGIKQLKLVVIDSAALTFDDNENLRRPVAAFMRYLNRLAERLVCTIALVVHPSRSSDGSVERMTSGSTTWVFGARFALVLKRDEKIEDAAALTLMKANYMKPGATVDLRWSADGVLTSGVPLHNSAVAKDRDNATLFNEIKACWENPTVDPLAEATQSKSRAVVSWMSSKHEWSRSRTEETLQRLKVGRLITTGKKRVNGTNRDGLRPF